MSDYGATQSDSADLFLHDAPVPEEPAKKKAKPGYVEIDEIPKEVEEVEDAGELSEPVVRDSSESEEE